jgi:uncharacterized membrane protein YqiK
MTVEDMISDQDKFSQQVRDRCSQEMESSGWSSTASRSRRSRARATTSRTSPFPHQAEVEQKARIARAIADVGRRRGADGGAQIAASVRDTEIKKAGFQAEVDRANQDAAAAGPARPGDGPPGVVQEETKVAELQAEQKEQQLQVDVRRPADAEAYKQTTLAMAGRDVAIRHAEAEAQQVRLHAEAAATAMTVQAEAQAAATRLNGQAEADAIRARGMAEADAVRRGWRPRRQESSVGPPRSARTRRP